jgi:hypothetical protein
LEGAAGDGAASSPVPADGQLSLFTAISAVPLDEQGRRLDGVRLFDADPDAGAGEPIPDLAPAMAGASVAGAGRTRAHEAPAVVPLPAPEPRSSLPAAGALARRRQLREQNSDAVADLARMTGKSHADLNAELNRRVRLRRISEASIRQLQQRLELARKLLRG